MRKTTLHIIYCSILFVLLVSGLWGAAFSNSQGIEAGYKSGYTQGYTDGTANGYSIGHGEGYSAGYASGASDWIRSNCTYYPFLLLDPSRYMACLGQP